MNRAALRRGVADRAHVLDRMHARELIVARERCFMPDEKLLDARRDELILDCAEALRAFRVAAPHVVLEAIRVRDESGRHGAAIIADPMPRTGGAIHSLAVPAATCSLVRARQLLEAT